MNKKRITLNEALYNYYNEIPEEVKQQMINEAKTLKREKEEVTRRIAKALFEAMTEEEKEILAKEIEKWQ